MTRTVHGVVRGKTIELTEDLGLCEGEEVELIVRTVRSGKSTQSGEGFLRTEGALTDDPYWDPIIEEIYQDRKKDTRREIDE